MIIGALASAFSTPVCPHVWGSGVALAAALQLVATLAPQPPTVFPRAPENEPMLEYDRNPNPLRDELLTEPFQLDGESVPVPQGPGLGIEVDPDVLKRHTAAYRESH